MKIFVGPIDFGAMWIQIAEKLSERGHNVIYLGACSHPGYAYRYDPSKVSALVRAIEFFSAVRVRTGRVSLFNFPIKVIVILLHKLLCALLFIKLVLWRCDRYIYVAGQSLLPMHLDLRILRWMNRPTICFLSHGGDSRPSYLDGRCIPDAGKAIRETDLEQVYKQSRMLSRRTARVTSLAGTSIVNRFHAQFAMRPFVDVFAMWKWASTDLEGLLPQRNEVKSGEAANSVKGDVPLRIMHCPSFSSAKGTAEIAECIRALQGEGLAIEYILVSGLPHREVLKAMQHADLIIDQLYSDVPLASVASESILLGKPVLVAGYEISEWVRSDPKRVYPHIICHPEELYSVLRSLLLDRSRLDTVAQDIRAFLDNYGFDWTMDRIEDVLVRPETYTLTDPAELCYFRGMGVSQDRLRAFLARYMHRYGEEGLFVTDKPQFIRNVEKFLEFQS